MRECTSPARPTAVTGSFRHAWEASLTDHLEGAAALEALEKRGDLFASATWTARILKLDVRTVYAALERDEIPHVRIGQKYQVPVAWLRKQAEGRAA
jgi:hypothetical protein